MRRFKTYSKKKYKGLRIIVYLLLVGGGFVLSFKILINYYNNTNDINRVNRLLAVGSNNIIGNVSLIDLANLKLNKPDTLLKMSFNDYVYKENIEEEEVKKVIKVQKEPLIYIYNTHQKEEYDAGYLKEYNIIPTVYMAANILQKKLKNLGIESIVEDDDINLLLKENNWSYNESYKASYLWLERAIKKYPSIKYFIDVHRDSVSSSTLINDVSYAKMMFVVGMNHDNYEKNEELVKRLNDYLNNNYKGLMRNIFYGKRSQYNQNFDKNTFLIEIGGPDNSIDEVSNSVSALAEALYYVIGES